MGDYNKFIKRMAEDIYPKEKKKSNEKKKIKKEKEND